MKVMGREVYSYVIIQSCLLYVAIHVDWKMLFSKGSFPPISIMYK